ncbi:hypothetical protein M9Y10_008344 [Tritrichomonas musculus]|uniref:non-specific serine/threonine protein kinase n=1 Tax=Tritrichomonas musculus TaxID=1915356 RepID=A0ABR2IXW5_9EUKA
MNKYQIIRSLGSGAAGTVHLARDKVTNQQLAIKEINIESKDSLNHTLNEIENMKKLQHPNIVRYHNSYQEGNKLYIVMEYIDGGDLASYIADRNTRFLTEDVILRIFIQIVLGLRYIHEHKIVHRDLKPQNIFITRVGVVKIGDFGVSRSLDRSSELMKTLVGTPYYLSPEIWNHEPYNSKTDIWSLGCILYELCALKKPYKASNINQLIVAIFNGSYEPLTKRYTENLRELVSDMLQQDPSKRPSAQMILQRPFITSRMQGMVLENEEKLHTVNIIGPESNSPKNNGKVINSKVKSSANGKGSVLASKAGAKNGRILRNVKAGKQGSNGINIINNNNGKKRKKSSPKKVVKKKNASSAIQLIDKTTVLPLPDSRLPRWALRQSRHAKTANRLLNMPVNTNGAEEENEEETNNVESNENYVSLYNGESSSESDHQVSPLLGDVNDNELENYDSESSDTYVINDSDSHFTDDENNDDNGEEEEQQNEWEDLKESTKKLRLSLSQSMRVRAQKDVPNDPIIAKRESECLEVNLRKKLGDRLFEQLLYNIENESNSTSKMYADIMEDQYPDEVRGIRRYILLRAIFISEESSD